MLKERLISLKRKKEKKVLQDPYGYQTEEEMPTSKGNKPIKLTDLFSHMPIRLVCAYCD